MSVFTKQIDADIRDIDNSYNGSWGVNVSSALALGNPGAATRNISLRFIGITIPQGAVINSAKLTFVSQSTKSPSVSLSIQGVAEDNTGEFVASPENSARTRTKTSASVSWSGSISQTGGANLDTPDIKTIVQEIVNRAGWASGNAMGFFIADTGTASGNYLSIWEYGSGSSRQAILTIDYVSTVSPSSSLSPSSSASSSASGSASPSSSMSSSPSASVSSSFSPSVAPPEEMVLIVAKEGVDALKVDDPTKCKFHSKYGTLKYFKKEAVNISFDASTGDISALGTLDHNLNRYPDADVYVRVYTGSTPSGNYEPVPFFGSGATVAYAANYIITPTQIKVYGQINGISSLVWHFDFLIFVYQNDLKL